MGLLRKPLSPETRSRISAANMGHPNYGPQHQTVETRAKISLALTGCVRSPETLLKMSTVKMGNTYNLGRIISTETREKMSRAQIGKKGERALPETRAKMSVAHWKGGRPVSRRKERAKRRLLGFNPLNSPFLGCEGHHINPDDVIYMPKKLHKSAYHNQYTGQGMAAMNVLAGAFLTEDWT